MGGEREKRKRKIKIIANKKGEECGRGRGRQSKDGKEEEGGIREEDTDQLSEAWLSRVKS